MCIFRVVIGDSKLQILKANHNIVQDIIRIDYVVIGDSKLQILKANHNKSGSLAISPELLLVTQSYKF